MELKEQLEVEEEDGDRQEEKEEVEREKRVRESASMNMTVDDYECAQNLSHEVCGVIIKLWNKDARAVSVHVRHASVRCIVSTSSLVSCLVGCMLYASFQLLLVMMLQFVAHLFS